MESTHLPHQTLTSSERLIYPPSSHSISLDDIDEDALKIIHSLTRHGYVAHVVGGGVRDILLGKQPKDFDIATDATPRAIKNLFRNSRVIGRRFKLVHVYFSAQKIIEVATFRDEATEDEEPREEDQPIRDDNVFGTEETDARRRDITINALFYDATTESIIDYVGGMNDLKNRLVRIIGDPDVRFAEDPVRLLRVVRHAARAGCTIEASCYESLVRNRELFKNASQVRIYEELRKDVSSGHLVPILSLLSQTQLLGLILPELTPLMFAADHHFIETLGHFDLLARSGHPLSMTVFLAIAALFCRFPEGLTSLDETFASTEEVSEFHSLTFPFLAVPRKEREKVEQTLLLWYYLVSDNEESEAYLDYLDQLPDLEGLLKILPASSRDKQMFQRLRGLKDLALSHPTFKRRPRRRRPSARDSKPIREQLA